MSLPVIVADIGINHCGKLRLAKALCSAAKDMGADYVKFQKRCVAKVYTKEALDRQKISPWGRLKYHQKIGLEFWREEFDDIAAHCQRIGIQWFASPWDTESLQFLMSYRPPFIKVSSACVSHEPLLKTIVKSGIPIIMSTGMSTLAQIDKAVRILKENGKLVYILHCASEYPTPDGKMNMRGLETIQKRYGKVAKIGLSTHNRNTIYAVQACAMGAEMIEFHITLDPSLPGDDQMASLGPVEMLKMVEDMEAIDRGWGAGAIAPTAAELAKKGQYQWARP